MENSGSAEPSAAESSQINDLVSEGEDVAAQPQFDAVDVHHAVVDSWLQSNPGHHAKDLLGKFVSLGAGTFMFKATEGRTFKDPRFRELVQIAADLGVTQIGAYHVNLRGDGGLSRVDEEIANFLAQIDGLPIGAWMVDWETWQKKNAAGDFVALPPDDPATGGTVEQTVALLTKLDAQRPGRVLLYAGLPMVSRMVNDARLSAFPLVYPDYRHTSVADPIAAATSGGITGAKSRMVVHQWAGSHGQLGFDSSHVLDRARFDAVFGGSASNGHIIAPTATTTEAIVNQLPDINPGDRGDQVKRLQGLLLAAGFAPGTLDGVYSAQGNSPTRSALVGFQSAKGIAQDGKVTIGVWQSLLGV